MKKSTLNTKRLTLALAVASTFATFAAYAQQADTQSDAAPTATPADAPKTSSAAAKGAAANASGIQQVVVTAQKRKEDASKVPVSISVLGGDQLTAQHIGDYADITRAIPNISFSGGGGGGDAGNGPGLSNIEIRGVSSTAGAATVGIYMDDVSMTVANLYSLGAAEPKFFDLDHVEVLRGPQGTLYGASSMGGTIKFITNQPNLKETSTDIYTEYSKYQGGKSAETGSIVFNKPLIPGELALRFGVQAGHDGGFIKEVDANGNVTQNGINWQNSNVAKFALKWAPTKDLTITPNIFYQKVKVGDNDVSYDKVIVAGNAIGGVLPAYETSKTTHESGTDTLFIPSVTINYATPIGDVTSVSSYFKRTFVRQQDGAETNSVQMANSGNFILTSNYPVLANAVANLPSAVTLDNRITQFSQELRLASKPYQKGGDPYTWLVGAYVANEYTDTLEGDYVYGINKTFASLGYSPTDPNLFVAGTYLPGFPQDNTFTGVYHYHDKQQSVFGEGSYYFTPEIHATVGMRYLRAQQEFSSYQGLFYQGGDTYNASTAKASKFTPKFSVIWETSPTNSVFATAAEGFRVGGNNDSVPATLCNLPAPNPLSYKPDSLWSYEVGNKSRFLDNKVTFNSALFYVKWKNIQEEIELPCSFNYSTNVGQATAYGGEIELKVKPINSVLIDMSGGYTKATLDNNDGVNAGVVGAVQGANLPGVPKYNMSLGTTYSYSFNDDYFGFLRGAVRWVGSSNGGFAVIPYQGSTIANPDYIRPAYHTVDLSTGVSWGEWEATLFVKNALNNNMIIQRPIVQATQGESYRIAPRVYGVSLSAKF